MEEPQRANPSKGGGAKLKSLKPNGYGSQLPGEKLKPIASGYGFFYFIVTITVGEAWDRVNFQKSLALHSQ